MSVPLTAAQKRHLRGLGHALKPVVMVGGKGLSTSLLAELALALEHHELVKLRLAAEDRQARETQLADLLARTDAALVQRIGNVALLYRRRPESPAIILPG